MIDEIEEYFEKIKLKEKSSDEVSDVAMKLSDMLAPIGMMILEIKNNVGDESAMGLFSNIISTITMTVCDNMDEAITFQKKLNNLVLQEIQEMDSFINHEVDIFDNDGLKKFKDGVNK